MYFYKGGFYEILPNGAIDYIELTLEEYSNIMSNIGDGGKLQIDSAGRPYVVEDEKINQNRLNNLRLKREHECFSVINRGQLWYNTLTEQQKIELNDWYLAWLDVTETRIIPQKPQWLK